MPDERKPLTYREAGVDIDAGASLVERMYREDSFLIGKP